MDIENIGKSMFAEEKKGGVPIVTKHKR
jgi:hypothetical protein